MSWFRLADLNTLSRRSPCLVIDSRRFSCVSTDSILTPSTFIDLYTKVDAGVDLDAEVTETSEEKEDDLDF